MQEMCVSVSLLLGVRGQNFIPILEGRLKNVSSRPGILISSGWSPLSVSLALGCTHLFGPVFGKTHPSAGQRSCLQKASLSSLLWLADWLARSTKHAAASMGQFFMFATNTLRVVYA
jgi:hypothetical protein